MIQVLKSAGYKSGKAIPPFGDLGQILKSETVQVSLQQTKNLYIMQKKKVFYLIGML